MIDRINLGLRLFQQLEKYLPQTAGRLRRWKDDVLVQRVKPLKESIERHQARENFQRDFKKAAAPPTAPNLAFYEAAKQRLDKRKEEFAKKRTQDSIIQTKNQSDQINKSRSR